MAKIVIPTSGLWSTIANALNSMFTQVYSSMGWWDYNDTATTINPISIPSNNTYVYITNNGDGDFTNKNYKLEGIDDIFDVSTNAFDFSLLSLGDVVDIRIDMIVTTTTANQSVDIDLEMASGDAGTYDILFSKAQFKTAGEQTINRFNGVYMGDDNTRLNPAKFKIRSDAAASLVVRGWYVKVVRYLGA